MAKLLLILFITNIVILSSCLVKKPATIPGVTTSLNVGIKIISLNGVWHLENKNKSVRVEGTVPGCVHTDLERSGLIVDPYFRFNDVEYRWIVYDDWTYYRNFTVENLSNGPTIWLNMNGLDTVAKVLVNGIEAGRSVNQFVVHHFDVTRLIQAGVNEVRVEFESAVVYAANQSAAHSYDVPPDCPPPEYHPECHANFIRKSQCSFSWDWGPTFPTQAIWKDVRLIISDNDVAFKETLVQPVLVGNNWFLNLTISFLTTNPVASVGVVSVAVAGTKYEQPVTISRHANLVTAYFLVANTTKISPWFPRGLSRLGDQRLYQVDIRYWPADDPRQIISKRKLVGFRTVEIVQEPITNGLTFYFKINGYDVYLKGSNWIPMDSFVGRITDKKLKNLLLSAVAANMNVLRVWGGGLYESDRFYELCDQLGIMVWQDFTFACAMYPVDSPFLDTVAQEVADQVMRIGSHPSLIAWSGNNENEAAIVGDWYGTVGPLYDTYKKDYVQLYIDTVMYNLRLYDVTRPFLSSSASNGLVTEANGWISERPPPNSPNYGDVHYYNYASDCMNTDLFPRSRFASEYGFQSWPSIYTLNKVSRPEEDLFYGSDFFNHRQHLPEAGNGTEKMVTRYFGWPKPLDKYQDFKSYIFLMQAAQSECYYSQAQFYRTKQSDPDVKNMGSIYWQHNDIWQAPSWATTDYEGRWKMAHYAAATFYADFLLIAFPNKNGSAVQVWSVVDANTIQSYIIAQLIIEMWTWQSQSPLYTYNETHAIKLGYLPHEELSIDQWLKMSGCEAVEKCFLRLRLEGEDGSAISPVTIYNFVAWKSIQGMRDPELKIVDVTRIDPTTFEVVVESNAVAGFAWLESGSIPGRFSDNAFVLVEKLKKIKFYSFDEIDDVTVLLSQISVTSLYNVMNP